MRTHPVDHSRRLRIWHRRIEVQHLGPVLRACRGDARRRVRPAADGEVAQAAALGVGSTSRANLVRSALPIMASTLAAAARISALTPPSLSASLR
jgi:hypothetical protein